MSINKYLTYATAAAAMAASSPSFSKSGSKYEYGKKHRANKIKKKLRKLKSRARKNNRSK